MNNVNAMNLSDFINNLNISLVIIYTTTWVYERY